MSSNGHPSAGGLFNLLSHPFLPLGGVSHHGVMLFLAHEGEAVGFGPYEQYRRGFLWYNGV